MSMEEKTKVKYKIEDKTRKPQGPNQEHEGHTRTGEHEQETCGWKQTNRQKVSEHHRL